MIKKLRVALTFGPSRTVQVGEMLRSNSGAVYFQYDPAFLGGPLSISPFKLKPEPGPQTPVAQEMGIFDGIFGVFADSLPDGWGLAMMSRAMKKAGLDFTSAGPLDRLAFVGSRGMGALVYTPATNSANASGEALALADLAAEAQLVIQGKSEDVLLDLLVLGGSPGGARPKVLVGIEQGQGHVGNGMISGADDLPAGYEHWLVKFRGADERADAGVVEAVYGETARKVGLAMAPSRLFADAHGHSWFGTQRFDRGADHTRIHMLTAAGLVHANYRLPSLDYQDLMKLTYALTRRIDDVLAMFRLATFNVVFHNRDDHAKNFAFLMSEAGDWRLAPAYDLTYAPGPGGEHTTAIMGEGRAPARSHLLKLGAAMGLKKASCESIVEEVDAGRSFMKEALRAYGVVGHPIIKQLDSVKS